MIKLMTCYCLNVIRLDFMHNRVPLFLFPNKYRKTKYLGETQFIILTCERNPVFPYPFLKKTNFFNKGSKSNENRENVIMVKLLQNVSKHVPE